MTLRRILYNANVLTQDTRQPQARAVAVEHGKVVAVGEDHDVLNLLRPDDEKIDLKGKTLLPGFNDAHVHVWKVGHLLTSMLDVRDEQSIQQLIRDIRAFSTTLPEGAWFQGRGYNEARFVEDRHPTRRDLDEACPERPAWLIRTCAHIAVANTRALQIAGISRNTAPPPGGIIERDESGEPTGVLRETALGLVANHIPKPSRTDYERMITAGCRHLLSLGVTSATDPAVHPELLEAYVSLNTRGELPIRMNLLAIRRPDGGTETLPLPEKIHHPFLRCDSIKLFADGGLSGATAALSESYSHANTHGVLRLTSDELVELAHDAHVKDYRVCTHAIGDIAIEAALTAYELLHRETPGCRHRIEHFGLPSSDHLRRMAEGRFIAVPQAIFLRELGVNFRKYLPEGWLTRTYPLRSMLATGIDVALSTDGPVVCDLNPLAGVCAAVTRLDSSNNPIAPQESISVNEAIRAYTLGGAIASGCEKERGTIAPGMDADFAILNELPASRSLQDCVATGIVGAKTGTMNLPDL